MDVRPDPFPHLIADGLFPAGEVLAAAGSWPGPGWPGWHRYGEAHGRKDASDLRTPLPPACSALLYRMALLPAGEWLGLPGLVPGLVPDLGLWGAGLHELPPGHGLPPHLDADRHARLGLARLATMALYLPPWQEGWGGELELPGPAAVAPAPGRLVLFANTPAALHRVRPVTGPSPRRSLALFWYGPPAAGPCPRPRAAWA